MSDDESDDSGDDHAEGGEEGEDAAAKKTYVRQVSTHLAFIRGFQAFPSAKPGGLNPAVLFDAVKSRDLEKTRRLLMNDGDVNCRNASGSTPLHVVVRAGDAKLLSMILAFHPDINAREGSSVGEGTPLHVAVHEGSEECVKLLIKAGAKPHLQDNQGSTALHIAARKGADKISVQLVQGASAGAFRYEPVPLAEILDRQGKTAAYWAIEYGHSSIADMLPTPKEYDPLEQLDLNKKANPVYNPDGGKKKKKKKEGGKDGKKKK